MMYVCSTLNSKGMIRTAVSWDLHSAINSVPARFSIPPHGKTLKFSNSAQPESVLVKIDPSGEIRRQSPALKLLITCFHLSPVIKNIFMPQHRRFVIIKPAVYFRRRLIFQSVGIFGIQQGNLMQPVEDQFS